MSRCISACKHLATFDSCAMTVVAIRSDKTARTHATTRPDEADYFVFFEHQTQTNKNT